MMPDPLASAEARPAADAGRTVEVRLGPHRIVADDADGGSGAGPSPLELMTGALAACSAMKARSHLEREGDRGDLDVVVSLDAGAPPVLYRRVLLGFRLDRADAYRLAEALERTEVTMMLRPAFAIRTQIEHAGEPLV
jgi:uncharacterized OsmC-like protein